jgi:hypothetical protein
MSDVHNCPHCDGAIANDPNIAGQEVTCPYCEKSLLMPFATGRAMQQPYHVPLVSTDSPPSSVMRRYGNRKRGMHPGIILLAAGIPLLIVFSCCFLGILISVAGGTGEMDYHEAVEFIDHPEKFRDREITISQMEFLGRLPVPATDMAVFEKTFYSGGFDNKATLRIVIKIPPNIDFPRIETYDRVTVRFKCGGGNLYFGNEAVAVER